ncbi:MAG: hypothetical protein IKG83_01780 [Prevotella sp.]|nr:hypothetical protein [Prevotella sp.]
MKKKFYVVPTCRVIPLVIDNHLCHVSKWNDGHGGTHIVINPSDDNEDPLPDAGGKEWNFDDDGDDFTNSWSPEFNY